MKVAIDTNALYTSDAGVARYVHGLLGGLRRLQPPDLEWTSLAWRCSSCSFRDPLRRLKTLYRELFWIRCMAPRRLRRDHADLLHETHPLDVARPPGVRRVVTLHDLAVLVHPERYRRWHRTAGARRLKRLSRADHVICDSVFTADHAHALLHLPRRMMTVVHLGCSLDPAAGDDAPQRLRLPTEYFLFVGSLEPGKNLELLRRAYLLAQQRAQALPPLVIVGGRWKGPAREGAAPAGWHFAGRQPDTVLAALYRRALALVFPSRYEGFGLPVLEAMTLGCPVVCSPVASLPEVGGKAVFYADQRPDAYLQAMQRLAHESALRAELVEAGREQSHRFSWERCAAETVEVYRRTLGDGGARR